MIRSFLASSLMLVCVAVTEAAVLSNVTFLPALPDLSLLCVIYFSVQNGRLLGETTGFVSGLALDFLSACPFGLNCLWRTLMGYLCGSFTKTLNIDGIFVPMFLGFLGTLAKMLMLFATSFFFPSTVFPYNVISWGFLFELCLNSLMAPVVFRFVGMFRKSVLLQPETVC